MAKKYMSWKTKGMNRDLSVTAFNPEFAFENRNLRLSTNEYNTLLSWVNEKGTAPISLYTFTPPSQGSPEGYSPTSIYGVPVGTAVINHKLIVFTTDTTTDPNHQQRDYIYSLSYIDNTKESMVVEMLFGSANLSLGFNIAYPLETLVNYESESIQKIYWTDGVNQPRVINVVGHIDPTDASQFDFVPELDLQEEITVEKMLGANGMFAPGVIQYVFTYFRKNGQETNIIYTTPLNYISYRDRGASPEDKVENAFRITVAKPDLHFDYLRIYSIQRTSINATPIVKRVQDVSLEGLKKEDEVYQLTYVNSVSLPTVYTNGAVIADISTTHNFTSTHNVEGTTGVTCWGWIKNSNSEFTIGTDDYSITFGESSTGSSAIWITSTKINYGGKQVYAVFETPQLVGMDNRETMTATVFRTNAVSYIDTGTSGDTIDPTELLYKGGETISAGTLEQKDNTLFLGNIKINRDPLKDKSEAVMESVTVGESTRTFYPTLISTSNYQYANQLTSYKDTARKKSVPCAGFKTNDYYRLGVQFQHKSGRWSEPIFVTDKQMLTQRPSYNPNTNVMTVPVFTGTLGKSDAGQELIQNLKNANYLRVRPVVVFPKIGDRTVICQGVTNPTVYTDNNQRDHGVYWQSSWFFRPYQTSDDDEAYPSYMTLSPKSSGSLRYTSRQITGSIPKTKAVFNPRYIRQVEIEGEYIESETQFKINRNYRTLHSPDIEFDDQLQLFDFTSGNYYKQVGKAEFTNTLSDIDIQTESPTISNNGGGFIHKSFSSYAAKGIVAGLFYDDFIVDDNDGFEAFIRENPTNKWLIYPWQGSGSLNNDVNRPADKGTASAVLKKKIISNLRYSITIQYTGTAYNFNSSPQIFASDQDSILKLENEIYKGNIDTLLTPDYSDGVYFCADGGKNDSTPFSSTTWHKTFSKDATSPNDQGIYKWNSGNSVWSMIDDGIGDDFIDLSMKKLSVRMKYKSTPHMFGNFTSGITEGARELAIVEVCQTTSDDIRFGGTTEDAFRENVWVPCGEPVRLDDTRLVDGYNVVQFEYSYGDTYFQRWDCLKTYAYTKEDINQIVEIGSFMLESHINTDGRYDRNRGQINNLNMSPTNFNLLNSVYSQIDNFFNYRIMNKSYYDVTEFPNQITWSKTKNATADVDLWTNVTMASILELDGDKGAISKIARFNDQLLCFQDQGISQILYNENTQISTTEGVPIEIANSGKVQGKRYISDTVGCSNKWSVVIAPAGLYFMDSNEKSIYLYNGQLSNLSNQGGFNTYCKYCIPSSNNIWNPSFPMTERFSPFVAYYDKMNQDILFITNNTALAFSEKLGAFTSFYDYGMAAYFCNLDDTGVWLKGNNLWKHQAGNYCQFFGVNKPYSTILIANAEPQISKTFTNLEFRATVDTDMWYDEETQKYYPYLPFDSLEVWDEYQHGIGYLKNGKDVRPFSHHTLDNNSSLNRKFRIWRCDVPRDNAGDEDVFDETFDRTFHIIARLKKHPMDRMKNPWLYFRLRKAPADAGTSLNRTELQDIVMTYFI